MIGYGIAIGLAAGVLLGAGGAMLLIRWGMRVHEAVEYGVKEGMPVLGFRDSEYEHATTDAEEESADEQ